MEIFTGQKKLTTWSPINLLLNSRQDKPSCIVRGISVILSWYFKMLENIFKPTIGNESLHQDSNDNGVRIVNFATSKNLVVKSTMFPHRNLHKYTWTSPDGRIHNQIDHILIDRRWHSNITDYEVSGERIVTLINIWWWKI